MPYTTITLMDRVDPVRSLVEDLHAAGFTTDAISVVFPHRTLDSGEDILPPDMAQANHQTTQGAAIGAVTGTALGTALAWLTGAGLISIPGLAPLLAAGPFLTIFTGMGLGASLGGIAGALVGMGVPDLAAKRFASSISDGRILVAVRSDAEERARLVEDMMRRAGGHEVDHFRWPDRQRTAVAGAPA
jgi:outer membrane lipoprotein SlyB